MGEVSESVQRDKIDLNLSCATGITAFRLMLLLQVGDNQPHNNHKITAINSQTTIITKIITTTITIITMSKKITRPNQLI